MKSRFSLILIALVVIFGGILLFNKKQDSSSGSSTSQPTNYVRGNTSSKVTLTEYGDFECPACSAYYPVVEQVYDKYKDQIQFQFRNFPLRQIHLHAMQAHRAAIAANNQGKFWEMYSLLYKNHDSWTQESDPSATFRGYAQSLGLDMARYDGDVKSEITNSAINADIAEGQKLGVNSTPTFFINGKKIDNPRDVEAFNKVIEDAINANK